jgi:uncharacterized protein YjeT (DUF2065 family)
MAILYTEDYKGYISGLLSKLNRMYLAIIPAVFGLLLMLAASSTSHKGFIIAIGVIGIIKGVLIYFNPGGLFDLSKDWLENLSAQGYRLIGIIALVLGTVVISWV